MKDMNDRVSGVEKTANDNNIELERRVTSVEDYTRSCNIIIRGLKTNDDDLLEKVMELLTIIVKINDWKSEISICHRLPDRDGVPLIIIQVGAIHDNLVYLFI